MTRSLALALLLVPGCISFHTKDYTYADVSPLLAPGLDVDTPLCDRLPGYAILLTSDPYCEPRGAPQVGVKEFAMSADLATRVRVFTDEGGAISAFRHLCRTSSYKFDDDEVRHETAPGGEACVTPYYRQRNDAHGAWAWGNNYDAAAVVRRGRLVVHMTDTRSESQLGASEMSEVAAHLAECLASER